MISSVTSAVTDVCTVTDVVENVVLLKVVVIAGLGVSIQEQAVLAMSDTASIRIENNGARGSIKSGLGTRFWNRSARL